MERKTMVRLRARHRPLLTAEIALLVVYSLLTGVRADEPEETPTSRPVSTKVLYERYGQGVTSDNNAAILLIQAIGQDALPLGEGDPIAVALGVTLPPPSEWWWGLPMGSLPDAVVTRPWRETEFPGIARWLERNEHSLERVVAATGRARFYVPLLPDPEGRLEGPEWMNAAVPRLTFYPGLARALVARAMLRLGEGSVDMAWADLLAAHRLGRLLTQHPSLVMVNAGLKVLDVAQEGTLAMAASGSLSHVDAQAVLKDLRSLPSRRTVLDAATESERLGMLDFVAFFASKPGVSGLRSMLRQVVLVSASDGTPQQVGAAAWLDRARLAEPVDWQQVAGAVNLYYDRLVAEATEAGVGNWGAAAAGMGETLRETAAELEGRMDKSRRMTSADVADFVVTVFTPSLAGGFAMEDRLEVGRRLTLLSVALAGYHAANGRYPDSLTQLVPGYLEELPQDPVSARPFGYRQFDGRYELRSETAGDENTAP